MNKRWDVAIVCIETGLIESVIGEGLDARRAEKRIETGLSRINDRYFVSEFPAGTAKKGDKLPKGGRI